MLTSSSANIAASQRAKRPFPESIAWALLLSYSGLAPLFILPIGGVLLSLSDLLLPVSLVMIFLLILRGATLSMPAAFLLGYLLSVLISVATINTSLMEPAFLRAVRLCGVCVPFVLASMCSFSDSFHLRRLQRAFFISASLSVAIGIAFFFFNINVTTNMQEYDYDGLLRFRALGLFGDSGAFGTLSALCFSLGLATFLMSRLTPVTMGLLFFYVLLGIATVYVSLSRLLLISVVGSLLAMPVLLRLARIRVSRVFLKRAFGTLALVTTVASVTFLWSPTGVQAVVISRVNDTLTGDWDSAAGGRVGTWEHYLSLVERNLITGVGYKTLILKEGVAPDNNYFSALIETGLLGFVFFIGFILSVTVRLFRGMRRRPYDVFPVVVMWVVILAIAMVADVFTYWGSMPPLMGILGVAIGGSSRP